LPISRLCRTEAFAQFASHLLLELPRFHAIYNDSVRDYRRRYGCAARITRSPTWLATAIGSRLRSGCGGPGEAARPTDVRVVGDRFELRSNGDRATLGQLDPAACGNWKRSA